MVRIFHASDFHLGTLFKGTKYGADKSRIRRAELWDSVRKFIETVKREEPEALILTGDLFEDRYVTRQEVAYFFSMLSEIEKTNIYMIAGNHDRLMNEELYYGMEKNSKIHIFLDDKVSFFTDEILKLRVYGASWIVDRYDRVDGLDSIELNSEYKNILALHCDINAADTYMPVKIQELQNMGFDYVALGHIHLPARYGKISYSGSLEAMSFNDRGRRGYNEVYISEHATHINFVPLSKRMYEVLEIDISDLEGDREIVTKAYSLIENRENNIKILLRGKSFFKPDLNLIMTGLSNAAFHIEIVDLSRFDDTRNLSVTAIDFIDRIKALGFDEKKENDLIRIGLEALRET